MPNFPLPISIRPLQPRVSPITYHQKVMTNEEVKARNLKRARNQVKYWDKESSRNQQDIARLKAELDEAFARGKEIVGNLADAKEYLEDLEQAEDN